MEQKTTSTKSNWIQDNGHIVLAYISWFIFMYLGIEKYLWGEYLWGIISFIIAIISAIIGFLLIKEKISAKHSKPKRGRTSSSRISRR